MAGLSANILTSKNRAMPSWPRCTVDYYYYGMDLTQGSGNNYFPAFTNDSLTGSSFKIDTQTSTTAIYYYNGQGVQVTTGVWNGGFTVAEAWSDGNSWTAFYMDGVDNKLYCLVIDTDTSPDTYRMASVDKDGTVVLETAAFQVTNTALNNNQFGSTSTPILYRVGQVDGTGNFRFDKDGASTDDNDNQPPFDGVRLEINTSGGTVNSIAANTIAETTDGFWPNNLYHLSAMTSMMGPTSNNIRGGIDQIYTADYRLLNSPGGNLVNMDTAKLVWETQWGLHCPISPNTQYVGVKALPWLGNYHFHPIYTGAMRAGVEFERAAMHNFMDELAVYYGIL